MNLQEINGVKVYNLTAYSKLPEWTSRAEKRKQLRRNPSVAKSFELIQELEMPDASTFITMSPDNEFLFLMGRYKPRLRCYDLNNLAMKFERCLDYLPLKMTFLSNDYSKFAVIQEERWVDVHAKGGQSFRFRIPRQGTDVTFCPRTCDLIITGTGNSIFRMNLSEGCFQTPWQAPFSNSSKHGFSSCAYDQTYNLLMAASNIGRVDGFDTRCGERVSEIDVSQYAPRPEEHEGLTGKPGLISCCSITYRDPLNIGIGTNEGLVHIYDIRQNKTPWHTRDTGFRNPVKTISFHNEYVLAMSNNCVKIWNAEDGKLFVGFDTGFPRLNWMHHVKNSGLLFLANESPKAFSYFIPLLGEAPMWAQHLDKVIYELDPENISMYDGYRFITRQQLIEYGMVDLVGTNFLRAYMHGYFVSSRLLNRILSKLGLVKTKIVETSDKNVELKNRQAMVTNGEDGASIHPEFTVEEKLESMATSDDRFSKLTLSKRFKYDQADEDVDLMRVHEARLKKKRRKKDQRKERAAYAKQLINKGQSDSMDEENVPSDSSDDGSRGGKRSQFNSTSLAGLREDVKNRIFDPNLAPSQKEPQEFIRNVTPLHSLPKNGFSILSGTSLLSQENLTQDCIQQGEPNTKKIVEIDSVEFNISSYRSDCLLHYARRNSTDFVSFKPTKFAQTSLACESQFKHFSPDQDYVIIKLPTLARKTLGIRAENVEEVHLMLAYEDIAKYRRENQTSLGIRYNPSNIYPKELSKILSPKPIIPRKRKTKHQSKGNETSSAFNTTTTGMDVVPERELETIVANLENRQEDDEDDDDDQIGTKKSRLNKNKSTLNLSDNDDDQQTAEDKRWNDPSAKEDSGEEENDYCDAYFDNGEADDCEHLEMNDEPGTEDYMD